MTNNLRFNFYRINKVFMVLLLTVWSIKSDDQLSLKIDSVFLVGEREVAVDSCLTDKNISCYSYSFVINYTLKNISDNYIDNISLPIGRPKFKFPSLYRNILIKLFIGDTVYTSPEFKGYKSISVIRGKLGFHPKESFSGITAGSIHISNVPPDSAYIRLEYNTLYKDYINIWKGEVHSQKYYLDEVEFKPCPGKK